MSKLNQMVLTSKVLVFELKFSKLKCNYIKNHYRLNLHVPSLELGFIALRKKSDWEVSVVDFEEKGQSEHSIA